MEVRVLVLVVSFLVLAQTLGIKCCVREEREALLNIKTYFLTNYNVTMMETNLSSWVTDDPNSDCCRWNRVKCHPSSGRVSKLLLHELHYLLSLYEEPFYIPLDFSIFQNFQEITSLNFSQGPFNSLENTTVLANLSNLEVLILKENKLNGSLPFQDMCKLKKIRVLDFSDNAFEGSLHKCLANLTSLQALDLSGNVLSGEIPASAIAGLTSLKYFSVLDNNFRGSFSLSSFTNNSRLKVLSLQSDELQVNTESSEALPWVPLFQLEVLNLAHCKLNAPSGTFPSFLLYQHDLHYLDLSSNDLVGMFPNWLLLNNTNLRYLIMHHNRFVGTFELPTDTDLPPPPPLVYLLLSNNKIEGTLPTNIGLVFPNLEYLYVSGNELKGRIPPSIGSMSKLSGLDLSRNNLSGQIPESLWVGCVSLKVLVLSQNNLQGTLPPSHKNSSSLLWLFLDNNYLSGTLEHELWHLPHVEVLDISNNRFWGLVPTFITNSSTLSVINLSGNNFTGTLPREFCKLDLTHMDLSHNKFWGSIPTCYLNMHLLSSLYLQGNSLVGSIPTFMRSSDYQSLSILDLRDNKLSGAIPYWIDKMEELNALLLGGNQLHGQLPNHLCKLKNIRFLDMSRNYFTGNIPTCFNDFLIRESYTFSILYPLDVFYYYDPLHLGLYLAQIRQYITEAELELDFTTKNLLLSYKDDALRLMSGIDLSRNELSGNIPQEIGYLKSLRALNLSHNHLNGSIPKRFHNLSDIESIDLSNNNLDGEIPIELQDLNFLVVFNVSNNNLSGRVPNSGQFSTFNDSCFKGNPHLIRSNTNKGNSTNVMPSPLNNDTKEDNSVIDFTSFIWSFSACYITMLIIMATVLWINPYWRRLWFYYIEICLYRCLYPYLKDAFW